MRTNYMNPEMPNKLFPNSLDFLTMYFTIAFSGIVAIQVSGRIGLIAFAAILYLIKRPRIKVNDMLLFWLIYIFIIIILQDAVYGGGLSLNNLFMWGFKLFLPVIVVLSLRDKFLDVFLNVMQVIAAISLVLYLIIMLYPQGGEFFLRYGTPADIIDSAYSTFFYSYARPHDWAYQLFERLYGPFSEPGKYAFFLNLGLILNYFKNRKFYNFTGIIFLISLLATQSTAGYISLLLVFLYSIYLTRYRLLSWVFLIVILVGSFYAYRLPFMQAKIQEQRYIASTSRLDEARRGRGHAAVKSVYAFRRHFLFGAGLTYESQQGLSEADIAGFSLLEVGKQTGIVGLALYCLGLFSFLMQLQKKYIVTNEKIGVLFLFASIVISLSSQPVLFYSPLVLTTIYSGMLNYRALRLGHKRRDTIRYGLPVSERQ